MSKEITQDEYLIVLGLYTLGRDHSREVERMEAALCKRLGLEHNTGSHVSDAIWSGHITLDEALKREGISVTPPEASAAQPTPITPTDQ